ncbi:large ribosomal subunit protein mL46 [Eucyclogobius newberryi]|uniref:large ribosomal subunit protein mL46 n=1 Tax=Eucyclogobius newberryi TaxID=166745 RepID=UPI003B5BC7C3
MAAPCGRMASRSVIRFLRTFPRTTSGMSVGFRQFGASSVYRASHRAQSVSEPVTNAPYRLCAAVYLQRLPVISADCTAIEQSFREMMHQLELEKSLLSDHELRLIEDAERLKRKQAEDYDSDEEDGPMDQDIVLAQDLEDSWEQKFRNFQLAPRVRDDVDTDLSSVQRCLTDPLVLVAEQKVGDQTLWLLPQTQWQEGEVLRQTAERALASLPVGLKATFLGNAPCGVYEYKLPKPLRTESSLGTKVFFFKAVLSDNAPAASPNDGLLWLKRSELQPYLKPAYRTKVEKFILDL